jgi:hypothetical protein
MVCVERIEMIEPDVASYTTLLITVSVIITLVLFWGYHRTRNPGFLWILLAMIVWPLVARLTDSLCIEKIGRAIIDPGDAVSIDPIYSIAEVWLKLSYLNRLIESVLMLGGLAVLITHIRK